MKIIHISNLSNGGRERRLVQLARGLDASGKYEQSIIAFDKNIGYKEILDTNAKIFFVTSRDKKQIKDDICRIIKDLSPDIVHVWETDFKRIFPSLIMKFRLNFKLIAGFVSSSTPAKLLSKENIAHQLFFLFSNVIVSNSKCGAIAKRAPLRKTRIIYNGFDYIRLSVQVNKEEKKKELDIGDSFVVMQFARFTEAKDWKTFVEIAKIAQSNNDNILFLAVGDGETLGEIKEYAESLQLTNLRFLGRRTDIEELLSIVQVTILLTNSRKHREGLSNTILESMAAGVPVIATNSGGTPEIISNSINGFMVDERNDSIEVYNYLKQLETDQKMYSSISAAAIKTVKDNFLLSKMTKEYEDLYASLLYQG